MAKIQRVMSAKLHPYTECQTCDWSLGENPGTREAAKAHAAESGHMVRVAAETVDIYGPVTP